MPNKFYNVTDYLYEEELIPIMSPVRHSRHSEHIHVFHDVVAISTSALESLNLHNIYDVRKPEE